MNPLEKLLKDWLVFRKMLEQVSWVVLVFIDFKMHDAV
jgi:hypothetical protein